MPAYWIARGRVGEPEAYSRYAVQVPEIIAAHGGKILARGGPFEVLEGTDRFTRFIVIEFPTMEAGVACFHSDAYTSAAAHRRADGVGEVEIVMISDIIPG